MTIENTEESTLWPIFAFLTRWLHNVEYDRNTILVIVTNDSLIGIGSIAGYDAVLANRAFGLLKVRKLNCVGIWIWCIAEE